jgi:hypothetical protein
MTKAKFEIDKVFIGDHNCTDLVKNQDDFPACVCYAVGDVIKYINGCHVNLLMAYLEINDGQPRTEGCYLVEVMQSVVNFGYFKEESLNEYPIMKQIKSDNNPTTQGLNASQVNSSHMDVLYGFTDYRPVFVELEGLDKQKKWEDFKIVSKNLMFQLLSQFVVLIFMTSYQENHVVMQ